MNKPSARRAGSDISLKSTHTADHLLDMPIAAVIDALPDAAFLYDARGRIARVSPAARRLFALDAVPGFDALPPDQRVALLKPRDLDGRPLPVEAWHTMRLLAGETITGADPLVARVTALDGRELVFSFTGAPIRGADGVVIGALAVGHDVTAYHEQRARREEVLLQEQLHRAQIEEVYAEADATRTQAQAHAAQLEAIIQTVPSRISIFGPDGAIVRMNRAAQGQAGPGRGGERLDEVQATYDLRTLAGDPFPREQLPVARALRGETVTGVEMLTRSADGGEQVMLASAAPILDPMGAVQGAVSVAHDITMLRAAERAAAHAQVLALTEANRRMDEFLGIAAHELRTPLTTTRANAQIALRSLRDAAGAIPPATLTRLESLVARIEQQSHRQERLVNDLVDVSRIVAGRLDLHCDPIDLVAVTRETVEEQRLLNPNRAITLATPPTGYTVPVVADADRVAQVITNYLTNALKYSHSHQPVDVSVGIARDGAATVRVHDYGPGLPPEESDRIWERFHRVPGIMVRSGSGIGLGLGLYIVSEIVARHGGRVGVESAPGHGATFWFTLPDAPDPAEPAP